MVSSSSSKPPTKPSQRVSPSASPPIEDVISSDPPVAFAAGIDAKDIQTCISLLNRYPDALTESGSAFEWLKDPLAMGLTSTEIVNLLLEESEQGPWICYELVTPVLYEVDDIPYRPDYSQPAPPPHSGVPVVKILDAGIKRKISELCGLGGIIPTPGDRTVWVENAIVQSPARSATISYGFVSPSSWEQNPIPAWSREVLRNCLDALDRFVKLFRWLQSHGLVRNHLVIFSVNALNQVEAVQVSLDLIEDLEFVVRNITDTREAVYPAHLVRQLSATCVDILRLIHLSNEVPPEDLMQVVDICALTTQALCIAILSFSQAHIGRINPFFLEHSLSEVILEGAYRSFLRMFHGNDTTTDGRMLYFQVVNLTCAGDMLDSEVMVFSQRFVSRDARFDLSIAPEDLLDLWGPGKFIPCKSTGSEARSSAESLCGIAIRSGVIYKPSATSSRMHWKIGAADDSREGVAFELKMSTKLTIGAIQVWRHCPTEPGPHDTVLRSNISNEIEELGTWPEKWNLRQIQAGFQGGQYLNASFNATWIKSDSQTRKEKVVERVDLDFLDQPWGLLVSLCTGDAQRVALREVVAEVISPMMDAWMEKTPEWQTLVSIGTLGKLKEPTFRDWFNTLEVDVQRALYRFIGHTLHKLCWTGVNSARKLVVACPQYGNSGGCIHVPLKESGAFTWILKDTEKSATFACLTNMCFFVGIPGEDCQQRPRPKWGNHVPSLTTSVCQYRWRGADDWEKLPRHDLQDGVLYWMGVGEDKRRVTSRSFIFGSTQLTISDSSFHWAFFRRMWERVERIRQASHIELRERRLMTEDHVHGVKIVRG